MTGYDLTQIETGELYVIKPWWQPPYTQISPRDDAKLVEEEAGKVSTSSLNTLCIYTDGSGINGSIGASAIAPSIKKESSVLLDPDFHFTVYTGELYGILLATEISLNHLRQNTWLTRVLVFTDNQAAISAIANPRNKAG